MIKIISSCGGDVVKFAGDALIVLWVDAPKAVLTHRACECAMELQDVLHHSPMTTSKDLHLSLKIGVGVGSATMFYVGGYAGRCEYFASGPALRECFDAAAKAESGDVIVSKAVWSEVKEVSSALFHRALAIGSIFLRSLNSLLMRLLRFPAYPAWFVLINLKQACETTELSEGFWSLLSMTQTFRKRSLKRHTLSRTHLSPETLVRNFLA